jgi:hypothetical protein
MVGLTGILGALSMLGFAAGGLGLLGVAALRRHSRSLIFVATIASVLILPLTENAYAALGMSIDAVVVVLLAFTAVRPTRAAWMWRRTLIEDAPALVSEHRNAAGNATARRSRVRP